jgi:CheY-like chemotaxis protein
MQKPKDVTMTSIELLVGPGNHQKPVVLLVDDDVPLRLATAEILRHQGFVVLEAGNAVEALALVGTGRPLDLVVSDVRMPGELDGVALSHALRLAYPNLPILLVSGHLEDDADHAADRLLAKPYRVDEFLDLVNQLSPLKGRI